MTYYVSVDIESDGKIPHKNSMLSLGAAVLTLEGGIIDTFSVNIEKSGLEEDPETMKWWSKRKEIYSLTRINMKTPDEAMNAFRDWLSDYPRPTFVGAPKGFDFMFVYWYLINFGDKSPFSFSSFDMKTAVSMKLGLNYRFSGKKNYPKKWFIGTGKHTHIAVEDAIEQGQIFINMMKDETVYKDGNPVV